MADRYWVGGTANWDATAGTKWSTIDGGPGGASVPTSADNVFFTAASGAVVVTLATSAGNCKNLTCTGFTGTIAGTVTLQVYGDVTLVPGMTWSHTGAIAFFGTTTLISAGKTLASINVGTTSANSLSLGDALISSGTLTVTTGTFTTNNYSLTASGISSANGNVRTIQLGSSTVTINGTSSPQINFSVNTNLSLNAGTSNVNIVSSGGNINCGPTNAPGVTFYNLSFSSTSSFGSGVISSNTFNNLSITGPSSIGLKTLTFDSPQTINGTLSTNGTAGNRRISIRSGSFGNAQTLKINSEPNLTDVDFRDIYVVGTSSPISGTRIGDLRGTSGIIFSAPKTCYWNLAGAQNMSSNGWASTPTGTPSTDNFPLPQDTATFTNAGSVTGAITMDTLIPYVGTIDMSGRTNSMTITPGAVSIYGDWKSGSGTFITGSNVILTFAGRDVQTITSVGKTFNNNTLTIDSFGGEVKLLDAFATNATINVNNGTFTTNGYSVNAQFFTSATTLPRKINLGSSTISLTGNIQAINFTPTNLTLDAGTSLIACSGNNLGSQVFTASNLTFYNVSITGTSAGASYVIAATNCIFNNLTLAVPSAPGITGCTINGGDNIINGTLTCAGASPVRRVFLGSFTIGQTRKLTVNNLSANNCDFRDITIAGAAAGTAPTSAGDCGGNSGITFPAPKTVYWNPASPNDFSGAFWATSSGSTTLSVDNFPLAQDTAVIDNNSRSAVSANNGAKWNIGTFDSSTRTTAFTFGFGNNGFTIYGNWKNGTGMSFTGNVTNTFSGRSTTQTITSNGVSFDQSFNIDCYDSIVQIADAFTTGAARTLTLTSGTFDAVSYNVTTGILANSSAFTLKMGSGTWTLSGVGQVWAISAAMTMYRGTANILLSDTSTSARTFAGNGFSYNKLTIGGTTGTSTLTISGSNQFSELDSIKTVAHLIVFTSTTTTTVGKWSIVGTAGKLVTLSPSTAATNYTISISGATPVGVDYLSISYCTLLNTSPSEFYVGANSVNTAGNSGITFTATPASRTLYWVGGTGNWSDTAHWSTTSGSGSGAAIPTSLDNVIFNSGSNATAYTATIDPTISRCASISVSGPASGNVTISGASPLVCHDSIYFSGTGITRTYTGTIYLGGSTTGKTITTNGIGLGSPIQVVGIGSEWSLNSALAMGSANLLTIVNGTFRTNNYALTATLSSANNNTRSLYLGSSTVSTSNTAIVNFTPVNFTFDAGASMISSSATSGTFTGGGLTFYNVEFTSGSISNVTFSGSNTFNILILASRNATGMTTYTFSANQTMNNALWLYQGTVNGVNRSMLLSDTVGTQRTLTCNSVQSNVGATLYDYDFRDIAIAGNAISGGNVSGVRLGDCKGNSGITFDSPKTVYYVNATDTTWTSNVGWNISNTPIGASYNYFPLAQDTAVIAAYPNSGNTLSISSGYQVGTIDMSGRTSNTLTLSTSVAPTVYGDWINGTGVTLSGSVQIAFSGRTSQKITSAGRTFTQYLNVNTPGGSVTLQDSFVTSSTGTMSVTNGTFDLNGFDCSAGSFSSSGNATRTLALGSGTFNLSGSGTAWSASGTNFNITGTGVINLTAATAKTFVGGALNYGNISVNQGGAGTLTFNGNNYFKDITNTYSSTGATTIALGTTTQTVSNFSATGTAGKVLTITGATVTSLGTLILNSGKVYGIDYLNINNVRAYSLDSTWYAGDNSINNGSLGWIYQSYTPSGIYNIYYGSDNSLTLYYGSIPVSSVYYGSTKVFG